jgi:hypothetical protein
MSKTSEHDALQQIINSLNNFDEEAKLKLLRTAMVFFGLDTKLHVPSGEYAHSVPASSGNGGPQSNTFSNKENISPKDFVMSKEPKTDIERVACLAYYLTHFRETPHFKTLDISKINTDAAQPKFSNAAFTVTNATNSGYLTTASKGNKQISAIGEQFVIALPDREQAKAVLEKFKKKRYKRTEKTDKKVK